MPLLLNSLIVCLLYSNLSGFPGSTERDFRVLAFYTARNDAAHISFVKEANEWLSDMSKLHSFDFSATNQWDRLATGEIKDVDVIIFLDTRPEAPEQREAFEKYMRQGGAWMGFHFAAFALTPSDFPQDWDWYHEEFLGSGQYVSNTWRPTSAILRVENREHPALVDIPAVFKSAPNEWYRWEHDLRENKDIRILLSIDSTSFPLGTGPKPHEIWHEGYYPVAWTNTNYRMIYVNMGHNDIDYENGTNETLSQSFGVEVQDRLILQSLMWLGNKKKK